MANNCFFDMHIRGSDESCERFADIMQYKDPQFAFSRIFSADVYYEDRNSDGDLIMHINGDCAWSVAVCMTDCEFSYQGKSCTLQQLSGELQLDIEVWSEEPGVGFQEHYVYKHGFEETNECFDDFESYFYDPNDDDYSSFEQMAKDVGHPEAKEEDLVDGWLEYKHEPIFEF